MSFVIISVFIGFVLVGILASKANRSVAGWILLSFLITPFIASLILYFINPSEEFKKNKGLAYLILLVLIIGLFVGSWYIFISSFNSHSSQLEIAESNQTETVRITSFEYDSSLYYKVQVQNNTDKEIKSVDFRVVYYDNNGFQIDYYDVTSYSSIDAHMTRTLDVRKDMDASRKKGRAIIKITDYSFVSSYRY